MATTASEMRSYQGPALFSYGFRPFFLLGAIWAAATVAIWLPMLAGRIPIPAGFDPLRWHIHELLYGYVPAVVAGFLLTAVPNWTGRLPVTGSPLMALVTIWLAGRAAMLTAPWIGGAAAAVIDLSFLAALGAVIAREIIAGRNTRNLVVLAAVAMLLAGNAVFHAEVRAGSVTDYGARIGLSVTVMLITLIGGRIIPSFTRNWLVRQRPGRLPVPFGRFDGVAMALGGVALIAWTLLPFVKLTAVLATAAALLHTIRLARWAGERTLAEPLVTILHAGYAFVPLGFALQAFALLRPDVLLPSGALHAWTAGAIAVMTLAVMTRASLGHTGRPLAATVPIRAIYVMALVAAVARIAAGFGILRDPLLHLAAGAWVLAFAGFAIVYAPLLARARPAKSGPVPV